MSYSQVYRQVSVLGPSNQSIDQLCNPVIKAIRDYRPSNLRFLWFVKFLYYAVQYSAVRKSPNVMTQQHTRSGVLDNKGSDGMTVYCSNKRTYQYMSNPASTNFNSTLARSTLYTIDSNKMTQSLTFRTEVSSELAWTTQHKLCLAELVCRYKKRKMEDQWVLPLNQRPHCLFTISELFILRCQISHERKWLWCDIVNF